MILSWSRRFIFIKGRKVAGTSVEMMLSTLCDAGDIVTPITQVDERQRIEMGGRPSNFSADPQVEDFYVQRIAHAQRDALHTIAIPRGEYRNHMSLRAVLELQPAASELSVVFVERNPYAKVLSLANHALRFSNYKAGGSMQSDMAGMKAAAAGIVSSGRMLEVRNIDLYRARDGDLTGTRLRYEFLQDDLRHFLERMPADFTGELPHAKRGLASNTLDPREFFPRPELDAINAAFAEEFDSFGYATV